MYYICMRSHVRVLLNSSMLFHQFHPSTIAHAITRTKAERQAARAAERQAAQEERERRLAAEQTEEYQEAIRLMDAALADMSPEPMVEPEPNWDAPSEGRGEHADHEGDSADGLEEPEEREGESAADAILRVAAASAASEEHLPGVDDLMQHVGPL